MSEWEKCFWECLNGKMMIIIFRCNWGKNLQKLTKGCSQRLWLSGTTAKLWSPTSFLQTRVPWKLTLQCISLFNILVKTKLHMGLRRRFTCSGLKGSRWSKKLKGTTLYFFLISESKICSLHLAAHPTSATSVASCPFSEIRSSWRKSACHAFLQILTGFAPSCLCHHNMQSSWNRFRNRNSVLIPNSLSLYTCFTCMLILRRLLRRTVCRQIIGGSLWGSNCASALEKSLCAYWRVNGAVQLIFGGFKSVIKLSWARYGPKDTQDWKWRRTSAKLLLWRLVNEFSFNLQDTGSNWPEWQLAM